MNGQARQMEAIKAGKFDFVIRPTHEGKVAIADHIIKNGRWIAFSKGIHSAIDCKVEHGRLVHARIIPLAVPIVIEGKLNQLYYNWK